MDDLRALKMIGNGGMGTVLLVEKDGYDRPLALKAMNKSVMAEKYKGSQRAETEKTVLTKVRHPFLQELLKCIETEKTVGFLMEYCPGGDLHSLRLKQSDKAFSESVIRFYAAEIVLALEYLHKTGIVYRDLKPENVLIQSDGHVMLTDFDLSTFITPVPYSHSNFSHPEEQPCRAEKSKSGRRGLQQMLRRSSSTRSYSAKNVHNGLCSLARVTPAKDTHGVADSFVGTDEYVSPEMVSGNQHGFGVDWWALGVLLYEMVYGKTPFKGLSRKETFFNILVKEPLFMGPCNDLTHLIKSLLYKTPSKRLGGGGGGARAVKAHAFFRGLDWEALPTVARTPFVPACIEECGDGLEGCNIEEYVEEFQTKLKEAKGRQKEEKECLKGRIKGDERFEKKERKTGHHWVDTVCDTSIVHKESYDVC